MGSCSVRILLFLPHLSDESAHADHNHSIIERIRFSSFFASLLAFPNFSIARLGSDVSDQFSLLALCSRSGEIQIGDDPIL